MTANLKVAKLLNASSDAGRKNNKMPLKLTAPCAYKILFREKMTPIGSKSTFDE